MLKSPKQAAPAAPSASGNATPPTHSAHALDGADPLFRRTLRTTLVLVLACVLFVGSLSVAAVAITSRAFGPTPSADARTATDNAQKQKPLSI